jgi:hypothetical protein
MSDGWRTVTHFSGFATCAHTRARGAYIRENPSLPVTRHSPWSAHFTLLRAYCIQVETYRRLRGGGEQNIRVEHVHVHEGGQAIVGAINTRANEVDR